MSLLINIGLYHFLILALLLFIIGLLGAIISKHILRILISLEIMFCGVTLNIAAFAAYCDQTHFQGSIMTLFIIVLTVVHITIGVAIAINIFKIKETVNIENIGELKG